MEAQFQMAWLVGGGAQYQAEWRAVPGRVGIATAAEWRAEPGTRMAAEWRAVPGITASYGNL